MYEVRPAVRAFAENSTNSGGFTAKLKTKTRPSGNGVFDLTENGAGMAPCAVYVLPFGTDGDGETFALRLIGWVRSGDAWYEVPLAEFTCTLGTGVGLDGENVEDTDRFADTIATVATVGEPTTNANTTDDGTVITMSPADNRSSWARVDLHGVELLEVQVNLGTGASGNALLRFSN